MDSAYSLEIKRIIDATEARELFLKGEIKNQSSFKCINHKTTIQCQANMTCANMYKNVEDTKKTIHFKLWRNDEHAKECMLHKSNDKISEIKKLASKKNRFNKKGYVFELRKEPQEKTKVVKSSSAPFFDKELKGTKKDNPNISQRKESTTNSIIPLVKDYLKWKKNPIENEGLQNTPLKFKDDTVALKDFFIKVDNQHLSDLPKKDRIYYGKVSFNKTKKNERLIRVTFEECFITDKDKIRPSTFLNLDEIELHVKVKKYRTSINHLITSPKKIVFFIAGIPYLSKNQEYINFKVYDTNNILDLIYFSLKNHRL